MYDPRIVGRMTLIIIYSTVLKANTYIIQFIIYVGPLNALGYNNIRMLLLLLSIGLPNRYRFEFRGKKCTIIRHRSAMVFMLFVQNYIN